MGLDFGITVGIAILDAHGNVVNVYSERNITRGKIISHILKFGNPVIIASDVRGAPKSVEKVATKLGCVVYSPDVSLGVIEKRGLVKDYYNSVKNDHEVDALASAIKSWKHYRTLFSRVDEVLKKFNMQELFVDILLKIIREESPNIEDAIREFIERKKPPIEVENLPKEEALRQNLIEKLQNKLMEKQQDIDSLRNQNTLLSKALNETRKETTRLKESGIKTTQTGNRQELKGSIEYIKKLRRIENRGYYPVIEIGNVDVNLLDQINDRIDLDSRVILVEYKENIEMLNNRNIKCVLTLEKIDLPENLDFPVVQIDKELIEDLDDIKAVKRNYIEERLAEAKKAGLIRWLKVYKKRKG